MLYIHIEKGCYGGSLQEHMCCSAEKLVGSCKSWPSHLHIIHTASVHQMFVCSNGVWTFPLYCMCCKGIEIYTILKMKFSCLAYVLNVWFVLKEKITVMQTGRTSR